MQPSGAWPDDATERPSEDLCHARESVAPIQIRCFGLLSVKCFGRTIERWPRRKPRELLAYLTTRPGMSASRQELISVLWPTYDRLSAEHLLRTTLWQLRRHFAETISAALVAADGLHVPATQAQGLARALHDGQAVLRVGERYALDPALCACDLHTFRVSLGDLRAEMVDGESHQLGEATRSLALAEQALRPLLQGESFVWLPALRRELQVAGLMVLSRAIDAARSSGDMGLALEAATRRLAVDPAHEETVEVAMRLHLERGSAAAAAACYRSFCAALARRYESTNPELAQPSGALRAL